mgnify:CR=1 FL=1
MKFTARPALSPGGEKSQFTLVLTPSQGVGKQRPHGKNRTRNASTTNSEEQFPTHRSAQRGTSPRHDRSSLVDHSPDRGSMRSNSSDESDEVGAQPLPMVVGAKLEL